MKLDRVIAKHRSLGRSEAHRLIAAGRVFVDGEVSLGNQHEVDRFMSVLLDDEVVQQAERALYLMMHKPGGVVSATVDAEHRTVIDLIDDPDRHTLHIAGRLDRWSTGLLILTNDGKWSKRFMDAGSKVPKTYLVQTDVPIPAEAVSAFAEGFHFAAEDIITLPAELALLGEKSARVTLHEGRHHQIKRMFGRVGCLVTALHRESIGGLILPADLEAGQWREMTPEEREATLEGV
ncbi:pseudouridine synthase [Brevifollis gellanilyticus]|uniref:Pseudouridine synthase n=1 Tax=Brevifollis gellanilyticus TaxID=748831 RepID=A0A512M1V6_9BACT|nr:16S rRNA pseudouridine(516) synthase [Brevifollis gellanilyticus]GEP40736.1 pseudouridine synthase [Brevifollis gellanilyticus]